MTGADLLAVLPLVVLAAAALAGTLLIAFRRDPRLAFGCAASGLLLAGCALPLASSVAPRTVTPLLRVDGHALVYQGLVFAASLAVAGLVFIDSRREDRPAEEIFPLLLLSALGAAVLVASRHFAALFLGLELLTVALYVLIAIRRASRLAVEAALKYLILAATASALLLFGMALIYAATGSMELAALSGRLRATGLDPYRAVGIALVLAGVGFKLAVVPFHMWSPDVYEGAPAPVAAFVATVSKGAIVGLLLRLLVPQDFGAWHAVGWILVVLAVASMWTGNLLALLQSNVKRILAYSSIAHLGYLLVALLAHGAIAAEAATYYLATYMVTMLGAFAVVTALSDRENGGAESLDDYAGLLWRHPVLAGVFTAMLLSLAGIPLTAGFIGKFYVVAAGVRSASWFAVLMLVANSVLGLFYYLRIVIRMCQPAQRASAGAVGWPGGLILAILTLLLIWMGTYPSPLLQLIQTSAASIAS